MIINVYITGICRTPCLSNAEPQHLGKRTLGAPGPIPATMKGVDHCLSITIQWTEKILHQLIDG